MSDKQPVHYGQSPTEMPRPAGFHVGHAGFHFLERIDYDGRPCGTEVYQWQPSAELWCRPNEYAQGRNLDLIGYRYVAACPLPPFADEVQAAGRALKKLEAKVDPADQADFEVLKRLFHEHLHAVLPKQKK